MKKSKMLSLLVICAIILSLFPLSVSAASDANTHRSVYLHARGENPNGNNSKTTIYMGDNADVYFAVDNPNKGGYEDGEHTEPRYDMNGYTVRICFDPEYFDIASPNPTAPIDYTVPDENIETSGKDDVDIGVDTGEGVPQETGYFVYQSGDGTYTKAGKEYSTAYITVFFSGGYVPQKTDGKDWYNLAKLPLTPKKTGSTEVFIDTGNTPYTLELFAKDESGNKKDQTFTYNAVNDGSHTIEIISDTPAPPTANPQPDTYIEKQTVTLAQEENCTIYYTLDGTDPKTSGSKIKYTRPLDLTKTTEIKAYAHRERDGKDSTTATFNYKIRPDRPYLFDSNKTLISDTYSEKSKFSVYASAKNIFEVIPDDRDVYYTFGSSEAGSSAAGVNPETGWVKVDKNDPSIKITRNRTLSLATCKDGEWSEKVTYRLSIVPEGGNGGGENDGNNEGGENTGNLYEHKHYVVGYEDGMFKPDRNITRAEVATIIARTCLAGFVEGYDYGNPGGYTDVNTTNWYSSAVAYCSMKGVFNGYTDGTFKPDRYITREELAVTVARMAGLQKFQSLPFTDASDVSEWALDGVYTVYVNGWITGYPDGAFRPQNDITRAETVRIFNGYLNRGVDADGLKDLKPYTPNNEGKTATEYITWPDVPSDHWAYYDIIEASNDHSAHYPDDEHPAPPERWSATEQDK